MYLITTTIRNSGKKQNFSNRALKVKSLVLFVGGFAWNRKGAEWVALFF
jgi:hypothetical protein